MPLEDVQGRFETKYVIDQASGCWNWIGVTNKAGYGYLRMMRENGPTMRGAHIVNYELHNGPVPEGKVVRHSCDNPRCVNLDHLVLGSYKDNTADCIARGRFPAGKKHWNSGTKWTQFQKDQFSASITGRRKGSDGKYVYPE